MTASCNSTPAKTCTMCKASKPATPEFFPSRTTSASTLRTVCRDCKKAQARAKYAVNSEPDIQRAAARRATPGYRDYLTETRDRRIELKRKYRLAERKHDAHVKAWQVWCRKEAKALERRQAALVRVAATSPKQAARNFFLGLGMRLCTTCRLLHCVGSFGTNEACADGVDPKCAACHSRRRQERLRNQELARLRSGIRKRLRDAFRSAGLVKQCKTSDALGCNLAQLKLHLERQFVKGMGWDNRSDWHIDHIVPLATAVTEAEVVALSHFTNLRPLWAADNMRKGAQRLHLL